MLQQLSSNPTTDFLWTLSQVTPGVKPHFFCKQACVDFGICLGSLPSWESVYNPVSLGVCEITLKAQIISSLLQIWGFQMSLTKMIQTLKETKTHSHSYTTHGGQEERPRTITVHRDMIYDVLILEWILCSRFSVPKKAKHWVTAMPHRKQGWGD